MADLLVPKILPIGDTMPTAYSTNGLTATPANGVVGHKFTNSGRQFLLIQTAAVSPVGNITITGGSEPSSGRTTTVTLALTVASKDYLVGPFDPAIWSDGAGEVNISYSGSANCTVSVVRG